MPSPLAANPIARALAIAATLALAPAASAQNDKPRQEPPPPAKADQPPKNAPAKPAEETPSAEPAPPPVPPEDPLPDLDDLLGLPPSGEPARPEGEAPPPDPTQSDLERKLSGQEAAEQFRQAVELMNETSVRLQGARDTGIVTQRLQEEIVRKLDMLIKAAQQQQQRGGSSSQRPQQDQDQRQQPRQQQADSRATGQGDNNAERDPPSRREGPLDAQIGGYGAAWGHLPARVRDALLQGSSDPYSSVYQKLTEAYYRRLAEEEKR